MADEGIKLSPYGKKLYQQFVSQVLKDASCEENENDADRKPRNTEIDLKQWSNMCLEIYESQIISMFSKNKTHRFNFMPDKKVPYQTRDCFFNDVEKSYEKTARALLDFCEGRGAITEEEKYTLRYTVKTISIDKAPDLGGRRYNLSILDCANQLSTQTIDILKNMTQPSEKKNLMR